MNLVEAVTCIILSHGSHLHDRDVARIEAEAFIANVQPHVSLTLLLAVAWVESRFSPTGSARDLAGHHYGVMQIHCDPRERECDSYLDPVVNIRRGATLLALRYQQVHASHPRARVAANWVGGYWFGSVPPSRRRRVVREWYRYAGRVHGAQRRFARSVQQVRDEGDSGACP